MIRPDPPGRGSAPRPAWAGMALHPPEAGLDLGLESGAWPGLHCWLGAAAWAGGLMCGGTPGGPIAVGSLGPGVWPWPASGAAAGGIACQPPGRPLSQLPQNQDTKLPRSSLGCQRRFLLP